jgi:diphthine-ammonia ligase
MVKAFVSWSGGKDSCLACYRAVNNGIDVQYLFNMATEDGARSRSHGLSRELLGMQAQAVGLPLEQRRATWADYEAEFEKALLAFRERGITDGVFGDIDLDAHRQWVEQVCRRCDITPHLPLWGDNQGNLLREFIDAGFRSVVVVTRADIMREEWLGMELDDAFMAELEACGNITPCGEAGEYHTFVIDGPSFSRGLLITEADKVLRGDYWLLDIKKADFTG